MLREDVNHSTPPRPVLRSFKNLKRRNSTTGDFARYFGVWSWLEPVGSGQDGALPGTPSGIVRNHEETRFRRPMWVEAPADAHYW